MLLLLWLWLRLLLHNSNPIFTHVMCLTEIVNSKLKTHDSKCKIRKMQVVTKRMLQYLKKKETFGKKRKARDRKKTVTHIHATQNSITHNTMPYIGFLNLQLPLTPSIHSIHSMLIYIQNKKETQHVDLMNSQKDHKRCTSFGYIVLKVCQLLLHYTSFATRVKHVLKKIGHIPSGCHIKQAFLSCFLAGLVQAMRIVSVDVMVLRHLFVFINSIFNFIIRDY